MTDPAIAARPCDLCRRFHFIEETGLPAYDSMKQPIKRTGPVPCECTLGCAKGHWRDWVKTGPDRLRLIDLFWASRCGGVLTEAEKRDPILRYLFSRFSSVVASHEHQTIIHAVSTAGLMRKRP